MVAIGSMLKRKILIMEDKEFTEQLLKVKTICDTILYGNEGKPS